MSNWGSDGYRTDNQAVNKIVARPPLAACPRPVEKVMSSRKPLLTQPRELTKSQLNAMLAEAVANTARLLR